MANILVIRHMYSAGLFTLATIFAEKKYNVQIVEGFNTDITKIDPLTYDAVVVLGGAMGVYDADKFPFLHEEIALIQKCVKADHPLLGICLGAQLMAAASGERVYKGTHGSEIGFFPIDLTEEGLRTPLRHFTADKTHILQWHGDTFDVPKNATLLATSPKYPQAFRLGTNAFAVQFHPEVNRDGLENTLVEACNSVDVLALRAAGAHHLPLMERQMRAFVDDLLTLWEL